LLGCHSANVPHQKVVAAVTHDLNKEMLR
jgi:hypothetical protein